ncbi:hypothetical protein OK016_22735 [Vibrio chagasii]|nr:hypothetical protein [Vibrio chagasii]
MIVLSRYCVPIFGPGPVSTFKMRLLASSECRDINALALSRINRARRLQRAYNFGSLALSLMLPVTDYLVGKKRSVVRLGNKPLPENAPNAFAPTSPKLYKRGYLPLMLTESRAYQAFPITRGRLDNNQWCQSIRI